MSKKQELSQRQQELLAPVAINRPPRDVKGAYSSQVLSGVKILRQQRNIDARERLAKVYREKNN